ncbi:MAG: nuclear transport factor 2 family protein [Magnetovibrio sp.]|nr:nuclear transport factor 2 family protein [Magnetovibrio sp.]
MTAFDSDAFFDRFNAVWQNHDVEGIRDMWTDDAVFEASFGPEAFGERAVGRDAATRLAASVFERIPDVRFQEVRRFATPEFAVIESVQSGTPRDGEPFEVQIVDLLTLEDGLIAAKRTYRKARL